MMNNLNNFGQQRKRRSIEGSEFTQEMEQGKNESLPIEEGSFQQIQEIQEFSPFDLFINRMVPWDALLRSNQVIKSASTFLRTTVR
jgi:hypothetical protein